MAFEHYIHSNGKRLRCGYTTGTCAALAAAGAARLLLTGEAPNSVGLITPKGITVQADLTEASLEGKSAIAAVAKDAGDDCDVTDKMLIYAKVEQSCKPGIQIHGGEGVGVVTKPGLDQPVGAPAINHVPRQMITDAVTEVCDLTGNGGGLSVTIFIPGGEALAEKTFNPQLGIQGGLSILGTSGIVEPMSTQALLDTIALELSQARAQGHQDLILTPGNYGMDYLTALGWDKLGIPVVKCSNFICDALDEAALQGFQRILLVGHGGKLIKLAGGIFNTHSRIADCRMELFCAHAALSGADAALCRQIMDCVTCDSCHDLLTEAGIWEPAISSLITAVDRHLQHRAAGGYQIGAVIFSNQSGLWGQTSDAADLIQKWKKG